MSETSSDKRVLGSLPAEGLEGRRALVRVDFNVPLKQGRVANDLRIRAALPTIEWLRKRGCRVVLLSHLGRPKGKKTPEFSLRPVADALESRLGATVTFIEDATAEDAPGITRRLKRGEVAVVEITRFLPGEESNDPSVAKTFAALGDFFVNDAFGTAHRAHASTVGVAPLLSPAVAGFLMAKELEYLGRALAEPRRPFVAVLGGAKISGKIDVIEALLPKTDAILIGGAMACTFCDAPKVGPGINATYYDLINQIKEAINLHPEVIGTERLNIHYGYDRRRKHRGVERSHGGVRAPAVRRRHEGGGPGDGRGHVPGYHHRRRGRRLRRGRCGRRLGGPGNTRVHGRRCVPRIPQGKAVARHNRTG